MKVIGGLGVLVGVIGLAGCATTAQGDAISTPSGYFEASAPTPLRAQSTTEFGKPLEWNKVDPRFRIDLDELAVDVDAWTRKNGRTVDAAPLLVELADAVDAVPRGDEVGPARSTGKVRALARILGIEALNGAQQRRTVREALLILQRELATDAKGSYAADPKIAQVVGELQRASLAVTDSSPESSVTLAVVTARDAVRSFALALATGRVADPNEQASERALYRP
jgi:hypothetical protein